ncbi:hypothetical protein [Flavobacterium oreochromis]|uniref:Uncharacterized protein n=1 Tax=Flavobacterium columnare TaxID=996 RepID=A0A246G842_9FLAO|nr:hypothetical protein [Flavobacterium oreochromis]OWP74910.1 hypothetical protein BWK62_13195 [Flavobacterium oreochromis]
MKGKLQHYFLFFGLLIYSIGVSQEVDVESFKKLNFKVTGGINANSVFYNSSGLSNGRMPFTYTLSGNINVSAFSFSMPLSYTVTNQGNNLGYTLPFNFNRLSLMPKYKWVKAYIGDVSMNFSPYTLSGHPFRGGGLELTPKGKFTYAFMGGRLLKAVEANESPTKLPVFSRMGYGFKMGYKKSTTKIEMIGFYAKDDIHSIHSNFDSLKVTPKENLVSSLNLSLALSKNIDFTVEYAISLLSEDYRSGLRNSAMGRYLGMRENTTVFKAVKTSVNYTIVQTKVGLNYERIDPNYKTLGTLFFANDLENINLSLSRPFLNNKLVLNGNLGFQRDDLHLQKKQNTKRLVGSINGTFQMNDRINLNGTYSNFTTYTNKKLNQFDLINDTQITPADTLNFKQLSQNATLNVNYILGVKKNHNLNFNYSISGQANEQGGIIRRGQASTVQNYMISHSFNLLPSKVVFNTSLNHTINSVSTASSSASGAAFSVSKKLFNEKMNTNLGVLYNANSTNESQSSLLGFKLMSNYLLFKKHNLSLSALQMIRKTPTTSATDLTVNFNYNYNF